MIKKSKALAGIKKYLEEDLVESHCFEKNEDPSKNKLYEFQIEKNMYILKSQKLYKKIIDFLEKKEAHTSEILFKNLILSEIKQLIYMADEELREIKRNVSLFKFSIEKKGDKKEYFFMDENKCKARYEKEMNELSIEDLSDLKYSYETFKIREDKLKDYKLEDSENV